MMIDIIDDPGVMLGRAHERATQMELEMYASLGKHLHKAMKKTLRNKVQGLGVTTDSAMVTVCLPMIFQKAIWAHFPLKMLFSAPQQSKGTYHA
jgi:pyrroline-5-carboxylate reductase